MSFASIYRGGIATCVVAVCAVSCGKLDDTVTTSQNRIRAELRTENIYERDNLPQDEYPGEIDGYFDIIKGAYRYIVNEFASGVDTGRDGRDGLPDIKEGDVISYKFDARIYTGKWSNSTTYWTNIEERRLEMRGQNDQARFDYMPITPKIMNVGSDPILKSIQTALISGPVPCKAAGTRMVEKTVEGEAVMVEESVESDIVRIYLTPDIAYGDKWVYNVPQGSTIVWELSDIHIIE